MKRCDYCGSRIILGGVRDGHRVFCNQRCHQNGMLLALTDQVPVEILEREVQSVHDGACPNCQGAGPVDVHTSYRVWSAVYLTSWSSRPHVCCRSCGVKKQLGDLAFSALLGWWGFPWGLILAPIQIGRNIHGMLRPPDPAKPSPLLHRLVCLHIAARLAAAPPAATPPPLPS